METLRKLMPRTNDQDHSSWRKMCNTWYKMVYADWIISHDFSSSEFKEWNPWKDWYKTWKEFQSSGGKVPKSERKKAAMFSELSLVAKVTRDKLEEAKTNLEKISNENKNLRADNSTWRQKCQELQCKLDVEEQRIIEKDYLYEKSLEKEVILRKSHEAQKLYWTLQDNEKKTELQQVQAKCRDLEGKLNKISNENKNLREDNYTWSQNCEELQRELDVEKHRIIEKDYIYENNLEKEVILRKSLEAQKLDWTLRDNEKKKELQRVQARCRDLEEKLFSLQNQLVEISKNPTVQFNVENGIIVFSDNTLKQPPPRPQLENGEGDNTLDLNIIGDIADRLGEVTSLNVFDWLCSCEEKYRVQDWTVKDFEQILCRCMDSSSFALLPNMVKTLKTSWLYKCRSIVETLIPYLDDLLDTEKMREDDTVLQYFQRMWMIYRVTEFSHDVSKDDPRYVHAICEGLLPQLYYRGMELRYEDYEVIEENLRSFEYFLQVTEKKRLRARKAGPGCPSRMEIWNRLIRHPVNYDEIHEAPFWSLVLHLDKYEDLETGEKRYI